MAGSPSSDETQGSSCGSGTRIHSVWRQPLGREVARQATSDVWEVRVHVMVPAIVAVPSNCSGGPGIQIPPVFQI